MVLISRDGEPMILGGPESEPFAKQDSAIRETRNLPVFMVPDEEYPNAKIISFKDLFNEISAGRSIRRAGVVMFVEKGYKDNYVYGPCHGTGMIEVEAPWMETNSDYILKPNMIFQIDTFVSESTYGLRWEKGIAITESGFESLSGPIGDNHIPTFYRFCCCAGNIRRNKR